MTPLCGFLTDSARCLENRSYYRRLIRFCAARGLNTLLWHFTDDQGCTMRFDAAPEAASPHAYTKDEMRALVRYARRHGITLIPELESLGHSRYLTRHPRFHHLNETEEEFTAICPISQETRAIMRALLHEVAEVFDSPYIHVGLDEVKLGGHPLTKRALRRQTEREIFADYALFLHREVTALGRRMIIWGDRRTRAMEVLPLLSRDIIIADWEYSRDVPPDQVRHFLALGFDVLLCPALITYDQPFLAGERLGTSNVRSLSRLQTLTMPTRPRKAVNPGRIVGIVTTVWTPTRYLHDAQWLALALGADLMHDARVDSEDSVRQFLKAFHGVSRPNRRLVQALLDLVHTAPLRDPYLALLCAETSSAKAVTNVAAAPAAHKDLQRDLAIWLQVEKTLQTESPGIRRERPAWRTLRLAVSMLVYLYQRALGLPEGSPTLGRRLLQRLRATWDRERFADDPRKRSVAFRFDQAEHLLLSFAASVKRQARK